METRVRVSLVSVVCPILVLVEVAEVAEVVEFAEFVEFAEVAEVVEVGWRLGIDPIWLILVRKIRSVVEAAREEEYVPKKLHLDVNAPRHSLTYSPCAQFYPGLRQKEKVDDEV